MITWQDWVVALLVFVCLALAVSRVAPTRLWCPGCDYEFLRWPWRSNLCPRCGYGRW